MSSPGDDDPLLLWLRHRSLDSLHARLVENGYTSVAFLVADDTLDREVLHCKREVMEYRCYSRPIPKINWNSNSLQPGIRDLDLE